MEQDMREVLERLKTTLNAAGEMAKQGLDMAGRKTGEVLDTARLRWKVSELQCETQQLFRELGQSVYQEHAASGSASVRPEDLLAELDKKHADIELLKRDLNIRRGERPCPNTVCPATTRDGDAFCRRCGAPLDAGAL